MTKAPTPTEKSKKQRDNTKTPPKTPITQQLRTDLGRSVGVTIATQLVYLNQLTGTNPYVGNVHFAFLYKNDYHVSEMKCNEVYHLANDYW